MRRGLISWSKDELPETVLDGRVSDLQGAMARAGLDAVVVYTTPARTAGVSWLAGFVPYWNQGLLAVPRTGRPVLVSALSNRVNDWIRRNAHVADVRNAPRIGAEAANVISNSVGKGRVGVVDLAHLPASVVEDIAATGHVLSDATELFVGVRTKLDDAELALFRKAADICRTAIDAADPGMTESAGLVATLDRKSRLLGAEEVYPAVAVDLGKSRNLVRLEGSAALGAQFAVRLSVAYKGAWVRMTRTLSREPEMKARIEEAEHRLDQMLATLPRTQALARNPAWLIEGTRTTLPLEPLTGSMIDDPAVLPPRGVLTVQATLDVDGTQVLAGRPVLVEAGGAVCLAVP